MGSLLKWGNDLLQIEFTTKEDRPVTVAAMTFSASRSGSYTSNFQASNALSRHGAHTSEMEAASAVTSVAPQTDTGNMENDVRIVFPNPLPMLQVLASGRGWGHVHAGRRLIQTSLAAMLHYESYESTHSGQFSRLVIHLGNKTERVEADVTFELPDVCSMFRVRSTVRNTAESSMTLESVPTYCQPFGKRANFNEGSDSLDEWYLAECKNDWLGEGRWSWNTMRELCPSLGNELDGRSPQGAHSLISEGTFSTGTALPMGLLAAPAEHFGWIFQVENNGAWRWEVGEADNSDGYLALSGPDYRDHGWSKTLGKGESFTSVPVSVAPAQNFDQAVETITLYRRAYHTPDDHIAEPKIIFNDYMNTLNGDPTTERLLPLIDSAAQVGAEIFCIDCGWYDDTGNWWPSVGEWKPSHTRFPNGLSEVIDAIKAHGMVPGLWMEPEVVGIHSPLAKQLPDSAFFQHDGKRVVEQERYMLDFRNPIVVNHMNEVVDRLIDDFGVGYFKFDYNVTPGPGTTYQSDSAGDGLLEHNRAYLAWIRDLYQRHPGLVLENCSSGGMRTDFAQTSSFRLQSTSDQQDYKRYATISATAPMAMLPEQAGNWAYPSADMDDEQFVFAMTNTMLGHFFLSGYLNRFSDKQIDMVCAAVDAYRNTIRTRLVNGVPFWPIGLPGWNDDKVALGIRPLSPETSKANEADHEVLITVWGRNADNGDVSLPVLAFRNHDCEIVPVFPGDSGAKADCALNNALPGQWSYRWNREGGSLDIHIPEGTYTARTVMLRTC